MLGRLNFCTVAPWFMNASVTGGPDGRACPPHYHTLPAASQPPYHVAYNVSMPIISRLYGPNCRPAVIVFTLVVHVVIGFGWMVIDGELWYQFLPSPQPAPGPQGKLC